MAKKIALFIDADNISARFGKQIIETLESRGEIFIRRIYGNWEKISLHGWNECILNFSLRAVQQPDYVAGKNATDMSLAIDAMDVLYGGKAEVFALVSNDSDFTPLAIRLREGGMKIIGMGNSNAANSFRVACDDFIDFDAPAEVEVPVEPKKKVPPEKVSPDQMNLFNEEKVPPPVTSPKVISITDSKLQSEHDKKVQQIHNILREAENLYGDAEGFFLVNRAGLEIKSRNLEFNVKDLGYGTLQNFIAAFPKLYELKTSGVSVYLRCLPPAQKISAANPEKLHELLRETAKTHGEPDGFFLLTVAGTEIKKLNFGVKDLGYDTLKNFVAAFPELYELKTTGKIVRCRCKATAPKGDNLQRIHDVLRETAKAHGDEKGFATLSWAGDAIGKKNLSLKDSGHSKLNKFISAFPDLYEIRQTGQTFSYRCR